MAADKSTRIEAAPHNLNICLKRFAVRLQGCCSGLPGHNGRGSASSSCGTPACWPCLRQPALPLGFPSSLQPGRYGKITTRLTFPETLDLSPYMAEGSMDAASGSGPPLYRLYAVVVHIDWGRSTDYGEQRCGLRDCVLQVQAFSGSGVE